jgi:hypothetical protein
MLKLDVVKWLLGGSMNFGVAQALKIKSKLKTVSTLRQIITAA